MNLPFGIPVNKEYAVIKKDETSDTAASPDRKLMEYRETLENYKKSILEYKNKLDSYESRSVDNQLSIVQTALDLSYLKELADKSMDKADKAIELLEELKTGPISTVLTNLESLVTVILDINYKLEGMDKNTVNRLSELILELQKQMMNTNKQLQSELINEIDQINRKFKKSSTLLWFLFLFNILSLSGLAFMILYVMEIIPF